jgi:gamma-glutamyltranspeptidase
MLKELTVGSNPATRDVMNSIAIIEKQRLNLQQTAGLAASCNSALRKLHELLEREKDARQQRGPEAGDPDKVHAVMKELDRVKQLAAITARVPSGTKSFLSPRKASRKGNEPRGAGRSRGRRTMGRAGGR